MTDTDMSACFSGKDFLTRMALLARFAGVSPEAAALFIHAGRSAELACAIRVRLSPMLGSDMDAVMDDFVRAAWQYRAPESLGAIRRALYRASARPDAQNAACAPAFVPGEEGAMAVLTRLVRLTTALSYPPRTIARMLYAGRFALLVEALNTDNRLRASSFYARELEALTAVADSFTLPECFAQDPELLARRVERIAGR
ncbi:MAG: hypothetical protein IJE07_04585 [Clostridia bacterium]|nr:hypothetical protein [Clostridia bacterium]